MKKETLARTLVALFIFIAVAIPFVGRWLYTRNQAATIELHARMPENGSWSMEIIPAKVGEPINLHITSDDVVHGFAIGRSDQPALEILPGEFVDTTLTFDQPGKYTFYCNRWCGPNHWRMRGTIEVTGEGQPLPPDPQPPFLKYGIDIDSPQVADTVPPKIASAERGANFSNILPGYALDQETYLSNSPAKLWFRLRSESTLSALSDMDLWDAVAWVWQKQTTSVSLDSGQKLYAQNCAACHGESGKGDGVIVRGLPVWDPNSKPSSDNSQQPSDQGQVSPRNFSDPIILLGESPALLEGKIIRGGGGTGMPYWGPIFTTQQINDLVSYIYSFAWGISPQKQPVQP